MNICPPSKVTCQFKVDDVVLIHDDRFPRICGQWVRLLKLILEEM
ncbi:hypothetical protein TNCT_695651, partial [Trichonephila clavata]